MPKTMIKEECLQHTIVVSNAEYEALKSSLEDWASEHEQTEPDEVINEALVAIETAKQSYNTEMAAELLCDCANCGYEVVAAKPFSTNPNDSHLCVVIAKRIGELKPAEAGWVVWNFNIECDGFFSGYYIEDEQLAACEFDMRGVPSSYLHEV